MKLKTCLILLYLLNVQHLKAQQTLSDTIGDKIITLSEVVVGKNLDVQKFISVIQNDSSFYKAFKNLHIAGFTARNDIRMFGKKGDIKAGLQSVTVQQRKNGCRTMITQQEKTSGNMYDKEGEFNYYTAEMYASLFFTKGKVCGENNIVGNAQFKPDEKSGMDKRKEQLKMLFFNPGGKITGIPFLSGKTEIYSDDLANYYDMKIDYETYEGKPCYTFSQIAKNNAGGKVVIDKMKTWFNEENMDVLARTYALSYNAFLYDFKVDMEVKIEDKGSYNVPTLIRYTGNWKAVSKKRENGVFTATLSDFTFSN